MKLLRHGYLFFYLLIHCSIQTYPFFLQFCLIKFNWLHCFSFSSNVCGFWISYSFLFFKRKSQWSCILFLQIFLPVNFSFKCNVESKIISILNAKLQDRWFYKGNLINAFYISSLHFSEWYSKRKIQLFFQ